MNVRDLLVNFKYIFLRKFFKRTGSASKVNTKSASSFPLTYRARSIIVQCFRLSANVFLFPSVNSRAELIPSPRANARNAHHAVGSGINFTPPMLLDACILIVEFILNY